MNVYIWTTDLYKAYIGEKPTWKPWSSVIAWFPFQNDLLDHSWNNHNRSSWGWTLANNMVTTTSTLSQNSLITTSQNFTLAVWADFSKTTATNWYAYISPIWNADWPTCWFWIRRTTNEFAWFKTSSWYTFTSSLSTSIHCLVLTRDGSTWKAYADWTLIWTKTVSWNLQSSSVARIGSSNWYSYSVTCWNVVVDSVARTADDVADYYNNTKDLYWLS